MYPLFWTMTLRRMWPIFLEWYHRSALVHQEAEIPSLRTSPHGSMKYALLRRCYSHSHRLCFLFCRSVSLQHEQCICRHNALKLITGPCTVEGPEELQRSFGAHWLCYNHVGSKRRPWLNQALTILDYEVLQTCRNMRNRLGEDFEHIEQAGKGGI